MHMHTYGEIYLIFKILKLSFLKFRYAIDMHDMYKYRSIFRQDLKVTSILNLKTSLKFREAFKKSLNH